MTRNLRSFGLALTAALALPLAGCDVDVNDPGAMPDVDVSATPGRAPDIDVHGPDVDVTTKEKKVDVPTDVDVKTEEKTIEVPDVDVNVPEENENGNTNE
jgi:hypothetical protein